MVRMGSHAAFHITVKNIALGRRRGTPVLDGCRNALSYNGIRLVFIQVSPWEELTSSIRKQKSIIVVPEPDILITFSIILVTYSPIVANEARIFSTFASIF